MEPLTVIAPGACVDLLDPADQHACHPVAAVVSAVQVQAGGRVLYSCGWWDEQVYREAWFDAFQVRPRPGQPALRMGFAPP